MYISFPHLASLVSLVTSASLLLLTPIVAAGQSALRTEVVATGLHRPVGFVQDPSDPATQYIVQHDGHIRVLRAGLLQSGDFLDLSSAIVNSGERGLLGLAFPPDYGVSGRFYVSFSAAHSGDEGHTVVARFLRASRDPLVADPGSRFDLRWSSGERFIRQPFELHKAGQLVFGPDGYLYISSGDGGPDVNDAGDPLNKAQDLGSLLGKILRIDVHVDDANPDGFAVPAGNPFASTPGASPEVWSIGFRNPWRFSFDAGTGAMIIGDVGQDRFEEIDYEPAGRPGRNYGWRIREGNHDYDVSQPPAFLPLQDPLLELDRSAARSVIGGFVYRGQALGAEFAGRYVFADFVLRRLYSVALTIDAAGEATASDFRDHTDDIGGPNAVGNVSALGVDAAGELYLVSVTQGRVVRLVAARPIVVLDAVARTGAALEIRGWSIDRRAQVGSGVDAVHVYAYSDPGSGAPGIFLGAQTPMFELRPDVASVYGPQFAESGFRVLSDRWLPSGPTLIVAYAHSAVSGQFDALGSTFLADLLVSQLVGWVDQYPPAASALPITMSGWALDGLADDAPSAIGAGVGPILVNIYTIDGAFVQSVPATTGSARADVAAAFGARFRDVGFSANLYDLRPGRYLARISYWMITASRWDVREYGVFEVVAGPMVSIDTPAPGEVPATFNIGGWAVDLRSSTGSGVDVVHAWAYPNPGSGAVPIFLGAGPTVTPRPDVGAAFGSQFVNSGYNLHAGSLPAGTYDVVIFVHSTITGTFPLSRVVRVIVP
jgi:glucose/arabinose dehydrogenase